MVEMLSLTEITLAVILGVLAAIVYSLRILVLLERRVARVDENLQHLVLKVAKEEFKIEDMLSKKMPSRSAKKVTKRKKK